MISPNDVTFVIPTFKLDEHRTENLNFVLPYIIKTGCKVLVIEQLKPDGESTVLSTLRNIVEINSDQVEYLAYYSNSDDIHKTGMVNSAVKNRVRTEYVWVNDVDFYMKFSEVFALELTEDFIQPYLVGKKLKEAETFKLLSGENLNISYDEIDAEYISLYGALSFIFKRDKFLDIGGMNEKLFGWGKEDVELNERVSNLCTLQKLEFKGIHLWHPSTNTTVYSQDMAIVVVHFNWCGFERPVENLKNFVSRMASEDMPVYGVELSLSDNFVSAGWKNWKKLTVKKENVCFQKEACINLMEQTLPQKFTKIAWIDADLSFVNKDWYKEASLKLDTYKLSQLFQEIVELNKNGDYSNPMRGIVYAGGARKERGVFGQPGGALAARREFFRRCGLYSHNIVGANDTILMDAVYDVPTAHTPDHKYQTYSSWKKKLQSYVNKAEISYVSGRIVHDWHGDKKRRNYINRNEILNRLDLDKNIMVDDVGLMKIVDAPDSVLDDIMTYFKERREDGEVEVVKNSNDMAIVSVHFNWADFDSPVRNLNRFILDMESNSVPLYGMELSLTGKFVTERYPNWIKLRVSKENVCFQKEACINMLEKIVPEKFTKIAWVDADIYFKNRNWYNEVSHKLSCNKVVQMFSNEIFTDRLGREVSSLPSLMKVGGPNEETKSNKYLGTPGAAIAARRDLWKKGAGLYPFTFMGGGDSVFMYSLFNNLTNTYASRACGYQKKYKPFLDWLETTKKYVGESCSFVEGDIVHYWHGDKMDRQYMSRYEISDNIDWAKSVKLNKHGIVELVEISAATRAEIFMYFKNRNEDGEDNQD